MSHAQEEIKPKKWLENELPVLHTPINSIEILRQKRLTVVLQLYERKNTKPVNFGYVNIKLKHISPNEYKDEHTGAPVWDFEMVPYDLNIISHNRIVGAFQAIMKFRIVGAPATADLRTPQPQAPLTQPSASGSRAENFEEEEVKVPSGSNGAEETKFDHSLPVDNNINASGAD